MAHKLIMPLVLLNGESPLALNIAFPLIKEQAQIVPLSPRKTQSFKYGFNHKLSSGYSVKETQKQEINRPNCPNCGAENPLSRGHVWRCRKCDIQWTKKPKDSPFAHLKFKRKEGNGRV